MPDLRSAELLLGSGSRLDEMMLLQGYRLRTSPSVVEHVCACGGRLAADPSSDVDVIEVVRSHNQSRRHRDWRDRSAVIL